tara:strand:- start:1949 stop:2101 length:153 start_codon:yes stop_codon:yes gene_type:complete
MARRGALFFNKNAYLFLKYLLLKLNSERKNAQKNLGAYGRIQFRTRNYLV